MNACCDHSRYRSWGEYQATVARLLLSRFSDVTGIYTEIEFCNSDVWMSVMEVCILGAWSFAVCLNSPGEQIPLPSAIITTTISSIFANK